jgi:hypothetical protein
MRKYGVMSVVTLIIVSAQSIMIVALIIFVLGAFHEIGRIKHELLQVSSSPPASKLHVGDDLPSDLVGSIPSQSFALIMSYGCSGCAEVSRALSDASLGDWSLIMIIEGKPLDIKSLDRDIVLAMGLNDDGGYALPTYASVIHDVERLWSRKLNVSATPTAIALFNRQVIGQQVAPSLSWFQMVMESHDGAGRLSLAE